MRCVTCLPSRNDDILASVLDAHRPIWVHDSQVPAMEVPAIECFLGGFLIREILQDPKEISDTADKYERLLSDVHLFHHKVSADDDFANRFPVPRDIFEVLAL